jgi:diaminopimelate epimerase
MIDLGTTDHRRCVARVERAFKYHGLGNDFVLLDRRASGVDIVPQTARALCDRHFGLGADGVLVILPAPEALARMVVHNADGSVAEMCGNGIRCVVKHLVEQDHASPPGVRVATGAGVLACVVRYDGGRVRDVEVEMGAPRVEGPRSVEGVEGTTVSLGNPHFVLFDRPFEEAATLGPRLERNPAFPDRTNVEWVRLRDGGTDVVVWERGVGLTLACGTGACAAAAAAVRSGRVPGGGWLTVRLPGGALEVKVEADLSQVRLRGPAAFVYEATIP